MKAIFPSSLAQAETMRLTLQKGRTALDKAQIEVGSGRHADIGLALGSRVAEVIDKRALMLEIEAIQQSNTVVRTRVEDSQSTLSALGDLANGLFSTITAARQAGADRSVLLQEAHSGMAQLLSLTGTASAGVHLFSGANVDVSPLDNYLAAPPSGGRSAVQGGFAALAVGAGGDASQISGADMQDYLDGAFATLFDDPSWGNLFSVADDHRLVSRISLSDSVNTSISVNEGAFRELFSAYAAIIDGDVIDLNIDAFQVMADHVGELAGSSAANFARLQSTLGLSEERLAKANERNVIVLAALEKGIGQSEQVDPYEAATRLTTVMNTLEASYAVMARLQNLTLLKYL